MKQASSLRLRRIESHLRCPNCGHVASDPVPQGKTDEELAVELLNDFDVFHQQWVHEQIAEARRTQPYSRTADQWVFLAGDQGLDTKDGAAIAAWVLDCLSDRGGR